MLIVLSLRNRLFGDPTLEAPSAPLGHPEPIGNSSPFPFLSLPLDLRLEIYKHISDFPHQNLFVDIFWGKQKSSEAQSIESNTLKSYLQTTALLHFNPLVKFLWVNHQTRLEALSVFYRLSGLVFLNPVSCLRFLSIKEGDVNLSCLTSLAISVPSDDTGELEAVFRLLVRKNVELRVLVLNLLCKKSTLGAERLIDERDVNRLSKEEGQSLLEKARARAQKLEIMYERNTRLNKKFIRDDHLDDESELLAGTSFLGKLKGVRFVVIEGNAYGDWNVEFELAVLALHTRIFRLSFQEDRAQEDVIPWFGRWGDWYWFGSRKFMKRRGFNERFKGLNPVLEEL